MKSAKLYYPILQAKLGSAGLSTFRPGSLDLSPPHLIHILLSPAKGRCSTRMMGLKHPIPLSSSTSASDTKGKGICPPLRALPHSAPITDLQSVHIPRRYLCPSSGYKSLPDPLGLSVTSSEQSSLPALSNVLLSFSGMVVIDLM